MVCSVTAVVFLNQSMHGRQRNLCPFSQLSYPQRWTVTNSVDPSCFLLIAPLNVIKKSTTATSLNKRFTEKDNGCAG